MPPAIGVFEPCQSRKRHVPGMNVLFTCVANLFGFLTAVEFQRAPSRLAGRDARTVNLSCIPSKAGA